MAEFALHVGDCRDVMRSMESDSVEAIVTDPPYGLSFMGKGWDHAVPGVEFWAEALRVAKPGAHMLAFGGTRLYHRLTCAIEDAGWEVRDCLMWIYGSGFPKSHNLSGDWDGWGTALKPAYEPVVLCRKPLSGTVAGNVLRHGCGGLNIDGCRVGTDEDTRREKGGWQDNGYVTGKYDPDKYNAFDSRPQQGRWPANVITDGSEEAVGGMPESKSCNSPSNATPDSKYRPNQDGYQRQGTIYPGDTGSAARYFYTAKASKADRDRDNPHPTVKPTDLMAYLCRLITPPGGTVLDPFMGSGSTGKAAIREGFKFIGIDLDPAHVEIARARILHEQSKHGLFSGVLEAV